MKLAMWRLIGIALLCVGLGVAQSPVNTWQSAQRGPAAKDLNSVYFVEGKRGWIGGEDGFLIRTDDGGQTWSPQNVGTKEAINDIYFVNKDRSCSHS